MLNRPDSPLGVKVDKSKSTFDHSSVFGSQPYIETGGYGFAGVIPKPDKITPFTKNYFSDRRGNILYGRKKF